MLPFFKKLKASKTDNSIAQPVFYPATGFIHQEKKLILPTLNSPSEILFWVGLVLAVAFYGMAVQFRHIEGFYQLLQVLFDFFMIDFLIVFSILGLVQFSIDRLHHQSSKAQIQYFILTTFFMTPIATTLGKFIEFFVFGDTNIFDKFFIELLVNTVLALVIVILIIAYFRLQHHRNIEAQRQYHEALLEQNAQLKARIAPHFFFNMLNTMQYLIETDQQQAEKLVQNVSTLYRASFDETKEVGLLDEIKLCQQYLDIEKYRFGNKLFVTWELPDEDILYDMVITSLTLQLVIEKMIVMVVEMSTEKVLLNILVEWVDDEVRIEVSVTIPSGTYEMIIQNLDKNLSFDNQTEILQQYFGNTASIDYDYWIGQVTTYIRYPLKDVGY